MITQYMAIRSASLIIIANLFPTRDPNLAER